MNFSSGDVDLAILEVKRLMGKTPLRMI